MQGGGLRGAIVVGGSLTTSTRTPYRCHSRWKGRKGTHHKTRGLALAAPVKCQKFRQASVQASLVILFKVRTRKAQHWPLCCLKNTSSRELVILHLANAAQLTLFELSTPSTKRGLRNDQWLETCWPVWSRGAYGSSFGIALECPILMWR